MAVEYYLEKSESGLLKQKENFSLKFPQYYAAFGLVQTDVDSDNNDTIYLDYLLTIVELSKSRTNQRVSAKKIFLWSKMGAVKPIMAGHASMPPPAVIVEPGIVQRFITLVRYIKNHPKYTDDAGKDLGIVGSEIIDNLDKVTPEVSKVTVMTDMVVFDFVIGNMHGVQIYTSYDGVTYTKFEKDYRSPWEDTRVNQTTGTERRFYKFAYIFADEEVGKPSDIVEIVVDIH